MTPRSTGEENSDSEEEIPRKTRSLEEIYQKAM